MRIKLLFFVTSLLAAIEGLLAPRTLIASTSFDVEWPQYFQGTKLEERELSAIDREWARNFPGAVKSFNAAGSQIVLRYVRRPTRSLHSARDCFSAAGFTVSPLPIRVDQDDARWGCFRAERNGERLRSCERVYDSNGASFSDVSAWYWNALLGQSVGPWWAVTVIE